MILERRNTEHIAELRKQGYKAVDAHAHTSFSRDVVTHKDLTPQALYDKAVASGMDFVTFTDHDNVQAHATSLGDKHVSGVELTIEDPTIGFEIHVNVYTLTQEDHAYLDAHRHDIRSILAYCREHNLPHTYNHPFWFGNEDIPTILRHPKRTFKTIRWLAQEFPVLEVNHSTPTMLAHLVFPLAEKYNKGLIINTDTHSGRIGNAYTLAQGETFHEWFANVADANAVLVQRVAGDHAFDEEAHHYAQFLLSRKHGELKFDMDNVVANALVHAVNKYRRLSNTLLPLIKPFAAIITRLGIPRRTHYAGQKQLAVQMKRTVENALRKPLKIASARSTK